MPLQKDPRSGFSLVSEPADGSAITRDFYLRSNRTIRMHDEIRRDQFLGFQNFPGPWLCMTKFCSSPGDADGDQQSQKAVKSGRERRSSRHGRSRDVTLSVTVEVNLTSCPRGVGEVDLYKPPCMIELHLHNFTYLSRTIIQYANTFKT